MKSFAALSLLATSLAGAAYVASADFESELRAAVLECAERSESCTIDLPAGDYQLFGGPIEVCPGTTLRGAGSDRTVIRTSSTAVRFLSYGECRARGLAWHGRSFLSGVRFMAQGAAADLRAGLNIEHQATVEDVHIRGYVQGVRMVCDGRRSPPSLCNAWRLDNVRVDRAEHASFFFDGGDVNVGLALGLQANSPGCTRADYWENQGYGECAGIVSDGFLGSTFLGGHVSGQRDTDTGEWQRHRIMRNPNARNLVLGAYAEGGQALGFVQHPSIVIGGLSSWEGSGYWQKDRRIYGAEFVNDVDPNRRVVLKVGRSAGAGNALVLQTNAWPGGLTWPLRMKVEPVAGAWRFDLGNLNSTVFARIHADRSDVRYPWGTLRLQSSLLDIRP